MDSELHHKYINGLWELTVSHQTQLESKLQILLVWLKLLKLKIIVFLLKKMGMFPFERKGKKRRVKGKEEKLRDEKKG